MILFAPETGLFGATERGSKKVPAERRTAKRMIYGTNKGRTKYGNKKTEVDGIVFDSKREAKRWEELKLLEKAGEIICLERQTRYCLIPTIEGSNGKVRQRAMYYIADFDYYEKNQDCWRHVVEDAKGVRTEVYKIKKKLMLWRYGLEIREV